MGISGDLHLDQASFVGNTNKETVVHAIDGSKVTAENCNFINNHNSIGPGLIDYESSLFFNSENSGQRNSGFGCEGFLLLDEGEVCEADGECPAFCCDFGDITCDEQTTEPSIAPSDAPSQELTKSFAPTEKKDEEISVEVKEIVIAEITGKATTSSAIISMPSSNGWIIMASTISLFVLT